MKTASPSTGFSRMEEVDKSVISMNENAFMTSPLPNHIVAILEVDSILYLCVCVRESVCV